MVRILAALVAVAAIGCAYDRSGAFDRLSEVQKAQFAKYQQFMTERQQIRYLQMKTDDERETFVWGLHVEARLTVFPEHVREAIWARQVVPGMTPEAVMLSWGPPERAEKTTDPMHRGLPRKVWYYRDGSRRLVFLEGKVVEIVQ